MEHAVALVKRTRRFQIGQPLPLHKVLGARDAATGNGGGNIAGLRIVMPLGAEQAVNPAVLVPHEAHVIQIRFLRLVIRHPHRVIPEAEAVHAVFAFRDREK